MTLVSFTVFIPTRALAKPLTSALPWHKHTKEAKDEQLKLLALVTRDLDRRQLDANAHLRYEGAEQAVQGRLISVVGLGTVQGCQLKKGKCKKTQVL